MYLFDNSKLPLSVYTFATIMLDFLKQAQQEQKDIFGYPLIF